MKNLFVKTAFVLLLSFAFVQATQAHGRGHHRHRQCTPRYYTAPVRYYSAPAPRYYAPPRVVYVKPVWIPGHWATGRYGHPIWVNGHYR